MPNVFDWTNAFAQGLPRRTAAARQAEFADKFREALLGPEGGKLPFVNPAMLGGKSECSPV